MVSNLRWQLMRHIRLEAQRIVLGKHFNKSSEPYNRQNFPASRGKMVRVERRNSIQFSASSGINDEQVPRPITSNLAPSLEVKPGDVLMTIRAPVRSHRVRCGVACQESSWTRPKLMMSGKMYRFRPHPEEMRPESTCCTYMIRNPRSL